MQVLTANYNLTGTGTIYSANVNDLDAITLYVDDNGGGSTITVETSPDNSAWTAFTGGFSFAGSVMSPLAASTFTAKGRFYFPADVVYIRFRVSTYVSGNVICRVEESVITPRSITTMLVTGLVAQGTTQATALPISSAFNVFATVAASTGAVLPINVPKNSEVVIKNGGANALAIYPNIGYAINGGTVNASVSLAAAASTRLISDGAGGFWQF